MCHNGLVEMKQNELNEKVSAWMDDELSEHSSEALYQSLASSSDGKQSFESYHAIRAVMQNETSAHWQSGFSDRVASAIADEPAILAPRNVSNVRKTFTGWAVAASVALAVVVGVQWYPEVTAVDSPATADISDDFNHSGAQNNSSAQQGDANDTLLAEYHVTEEEKAQLDRINTIFSRYSQQNGSTANAQISNVSQSSQQSLPYVRLVSGEQVKTFRMTPKQFRQVMVELEKRNREAELKAQQEMQNGRP